MAERHRVREVGGLLRQWVREGRERGEKGEFWRQRIGYIGQ